MMRRFRKVPRRVLVNVIILGVTLAAVMLSNVLAPADPNRNSLSDRLIAPIGFGGTLAHSLGTDALGRDIWSRLLHGGRISLAIAAAASVIGVVCGSMLGIASGYWGGLLDQFLMYLVDVQLSLPFILLAIVAVIALGSTPIVLVCLAALTTWPTYARLCRGLILTLRGRDFVTAARAIGAGHGRIIRVHLIPNLIGPLLVLITLNMGRIILVESGLSFLGIGIKPPDPSWGNMIAEGRQYLSTAWWLALIPSVALILVTVAVGTVGDWLRDLTDVRLDT